MDLAVKEVNKDQISVLNFTNDQLKAYEELISFIDSEYNPKDCKRALVGAAGTGKTYLVKALIKNSKCSYSTIGLAAPTHKACRVLAESINIPSIKVKTLQSDLGLKLNFDIEKFDINNPPFDPKGRVKIDDYKIYIVDEASMIPRGLCMFLEKICVSKKCKIIYIGDKYQLPPVGEKYSSAFKNIKICELKQIVRQNDTNPIRKLLTLLRQDIDNKSFHFLEYIYRHPIEFDENNIEGYKCCNYEEFKQIVYNNFNDEELTKNVDFVKLLGYTNENINGWNKFIRNCIIKDSDKSIITKNDLILSYISIVNQFNEVVIKNSEEYIVYDIVDYVHPQYEIEGFIVKLQAIFGGQVTPPLFIVNHKNPYSVQKYVSISNNLVNEAKRASSGMRAQCWRDYFEFKEGCLLLTDIKDQDGNILYKRNLDYGFALTSHKSQGSTFDTSIVDINNIVYNKNGKMYNDAEFINRLLYVACSRCKHKLYLNFSPNV